MIFALLYLAALVVSHVLAYKGYRRCLLVVTLPLLALDCLANCLVFFQSWRNTMSGEAWYHRNHKYWGWCYPCINWLFAWQKHDHCKVQAEKERLYGGFWPAWWHDFKVGR